MLMKHAKRIFGLLLALAMMLSLFAGCGKESAETESTVSGGLALIDESALAHLDKTSIAYVKTWFQMILPDFRVEIFDSGDGKRDNCGHNQNKDHHILELFGKPLEIGFLFLLP